MKSHGVESDCDEFICGKCAKTDHTDHEWSTIPTAANQRRRGLLKFLKKIKEEDLPVIDEKIEKIPQQIIENKELCETEIKKLQKHYDETLNRLFEIRKCHGKTLRGNLVKKNDQLNCMKYELEKKKRGIVDRVEFMEENNSTMSDYSFIDNYRELTKMLSELEFHTKNCKHSVRFSRGEINVGLLESLLGKTWDIDNIDVTHKKSFQYGDKAISALETFTKNQCYICEHQSKIIEKVNMEGTKKHRFSVNSPTYDMCVTDYGDVYFTDYCNKSISCLSPSGSVSTVVSTDPLEPGGICQSVGGGLLVTLSSKEADPFKLQSHSRRVVRHITVTGDVIHEYEYQEDGHTRLFTYPVRVIQNSDFDICVVNSTSLTTGDLVIMSPFGRVKLIYRGQNLTEKFCPVDIVCDSLCNILVTDLLNKQIHLLSFDCEFLKFLLTENEVNSPYSLSLYESTLWIGYLEGLVKVYQFKV
ncbi:uncharacterized protein LOC134237215 [Saccostrea cucullata]|uniref:uncharacterized protein LOC134237215 n=1 Tax=Saccostrea cuccullata TaxID=36930 RepID=UPI002ECFB812